MKGISPTDPLRLRIRASIEALEQTPERLADIEEELAVWLGDAAEAEGLEPTSVSGAELDAWLAEQVPDWPALVTRLSKTGARHQRPSSSRDRTPVGSPPARLFSRPSCMSCVSACASCGDDRPLP